MRRSVLPLSLAAALVLAACGTDVDVEPETTLDASPTATATVTETETVTAEPTTPATTPTTPGDGTPTDGATSPGDDDVASIAFTDCGADRYTVGYPADWNTNEPDDLTDECRIFHPGEIETADQPRGRDLHWAVSIYIDAVEYEDVRDADGPDDEIDRRELTVDGRDAFVRETRSSGEALMPEGERRYAYTIDLEGEILVAVTYSIGDSDYERDKAILDRMVTEELAISE